MLMEVSAPPLAGPKIGDPRPGSQGEDILFMTCEPQYRHYGPSARFGEFPPSAHRARPGLVSTFGCLLLSCATYESNPASAKTPLSFTAVASTSVLLWSVLPGMSHTRKA